MNQEASENLRVDALTNKIRPPLPFVVDGPEDLQRLRAEWARLDSIPRLLAGREEGIDHSWAGIDIRTLLRGDDSSGRQSYHDMILPPGTGLPRHVRTDGDTYWYVFSGEVEMTIGSVCRSVGAGAFGYAPAETTQAVFNRGGTEPARLIIGYFPAGADRGFAEAHERWKATGEANPERYFDVLQKYGFDFSITGPRELDARTNQPVERLEHAVRTAADFEALRSAWRRRAATPKLVDAPDREGKQDRGTVSGNVIVSGDDDSGRAVFMHGVVDPRHTAPTHHQPGEEESFFVVAGDVRLTCGSETALVGPGAFGFAPRHATHTFHNPAEHPTRIISCNSPAGHERGFEMMVRERAQPTGNFAGLLAAHGWQMHPTPDLQAH